MAKGIKVGDVMTRNFVSVSSETSLTDCAKEMMKKRVGSLILKDSNKLVGLLTEKDIIWALTKTGNKNFSKIKAGDVASRKIATIKPGAELNEAMSRMKKLKFRRLPVVSGGNVLGMLTLKDILRISPELMVDVDFSGKIKEESEKLKRMKNTRWIKEGECEECGNFNILYKTDGRLMCEQCREEM